MQVTTLPIIIMRGDWIFFLQLVVGEIRYVNNEVLGNNDVLRLRKEDVVQNELREVSDVVRDHLLRFSVVRWENFSIVLIY